MSIFVPFPPVFAPTIAVITNITNGNPAVVTTLNDHNYINGIILRLDIPPGFGMVQANQQFGPIAVTGPTTFTIAIDTTLYDTFVTPMSSTQQAQAVPFAEVNEILTAAVQNVLPN